MFRVRNNEIYIVRGDSALLAVSATVTEGSTTQAYTFQVGDKVKLAVKRHPSESTELVSKEVTVDTAGTTVNITFNPSDTKELLFGNYYYDIQLIKSNGWVDTIIPVNLFKVGEEIG